MRKSLIAVLAIAAILVVGCASSEAPAEQSQTDELIQSLVDRIATLESGQASDEQWWERDSDYDAETDTLYVVAFMKMSNPVTSRMAAEELAIDEAARMVSLDVDNARSLLIADGGEMYGNTQAMADLDALTFTETDFTLVGMRVERTHIADDGTAYVQVSIPYQANLDSAINGVLDTQDFERDAAAVYADALHELAYSNRRADAAAGL